MDVSIDCRECSRLLIGGERERERERKGVTEGEVVWELLQESSMFHFLVRVLHLITGGVCDDPCWRKSGLTCFGIVVKNDVSLVCFKDVGIAEGAEFFPVDLGKPAFISVKRLIGIISVGRLENMRCFW